MTGHLTSGPSNGRIFSHAFGDVASRVPPADEARPKVLLGDEQGVLRDGIASLLGDRRLARVVGSTDDGNECVRLCARERPEVLIFDTAMRGLCGTEVVRRVARHSPATRLLCLSAREEPRWVRAAFEAGAHAYVLKRDATSVLVDAIDAVMQSRGYVSAEIAHVLVDGWRAGTTPRGRPAEALSKRERQIATLYAEGRTTREIAERLHVSMKTVGTHRDHIMTKLGIRGIAPLTRYVLREGWVSLDA